MLFPLVLGGFFLYFLGGSDLLYCFFYRKYDDKPRPVWGVVSVMAVIIAVVCLIIAVTLEKFFPLTTGILAVVSFLAFLYGEIRCALANRPASGRELVIHLLLMILALVCGMLAIFTYCY
jgi:peptidoglycan/LPS O-acetylase OafA/YrhL